MFFGRSLLSVHTPPCELRGSRNSSRLSSSQAPRPQKGTRTVRSEIGMSKLGFLFFLSIVGSLSYCVYKVLPFYYDYYEVLGLMEEQASKSQILTDIEIRNNILAKIRKLGIPIGNEGNLKIQRMGSHTRIEFRYKEVLDVDFGQGRYYKLWVFDFHPYADREAGR